MCARTILPIIMVSLTLASAGYSQVSVNNQDGPQTPSDVARFLVDHGPVVQVPAKGKVKYSIKKEAPTFAMPGGRSSIVLLRLPDYQAPYGMTITSSVKSGFGRKRPIFIPSGLSFDAEFQRAGEFGEDRLLGREESVATEIAFDETSRNARYLVLYTRGDLVGEPVEIRANVYGVKVGGKVGRLLAGYSPERSLEGNIQVETKSETKPK